MDTIPAKTILSGYTDKGWFGTHYHMNIYRGCCHGCIYCDSRSDCYHVENFDTVRAKADALRILRDDLRRKVKTGVVATGAMSDPYNPFEKEQQLTRHALELLSAYGFGAAIATKSDLILRDIDVLREIAAHSPVLCKLTVTTCDEKLAAKIEPRAPGPFRRLTAVEKLAGAGLFTGILLMPVLPFLEDTPAGILDVVRRAADSGARFIYPAFGVTLRANQRDYFFDRLEEAFPDQNLKAQYIRRFGQAYECRSPRARELWDVFTGACRETGLLYHMRDIVSAYKQGYETEQLRLF